MRNFFLIPLNVSFYLSQSFTKVLEFLTRSLQNPRNGTQNISVSLSGTRVLCNSIHIRRLIGITDLSWLNEFFDIHFLGFSLCFLFLCMCFHWYCRCPTFLCAWCRRRSNLRSKFQEKCKYFLDSSKEVYVGEDYNIKCECDFYFIYLEFGERLVYVYFLFFWV